MSDMESTLDKIDELITKWSKMEYAAAELEAEFKGWEASQKSLHIDDGMPISKAESLVKGTSDWNTKFLDWQKASIYAKRLGKEIDNEIRRWETKRSRYSKEGRIV